MGRGRAATLWTISIANGTKRKHKRVILVCLLSNESLIDWLLLSLLLLVVVGWWSANLDVERTMNYRRELFRQEKRNSREAFEWPNERSIVLENFEGIRNGVLFSRNHSHAFVRNYMDQPLRTGWLASTSESTAPLVRSRPGHPSKEGISMLFVQAGMKWIHPLSACLVDSIQVLLYPFS